jgi:hypothetical protein
MEDRKTSQEAVTVIQKDKRWELKLSQHQTLPKGEGTSIEGEVSTHRTGHLKFCWVRLSINGNRIPGHE